MILAVLPIIGGWMAAPEFLGKPDYFARFLDPVFTQGTVAAAEAAEPARNTLEAPLAVVAVFTALVGLLVAWWLYLRQPGKPEQLAKSMRGLYNTLLHKYYLDEIYAALIVNPLLWISTTSFCPTVDGRAIDATSATVAQR